MCVLFNYKTECLVLRTIRKKVDKIQNKKALVLFLSLSRWHFVWLSKCSTGENVMNSYWIHMEVPFAVCWHQRINRHPNGLVAKWNFSFRIGQTNLQCKFCTIKIMVIQDRNIQIAFYMKCIKQRVKGIPHYRIDKISLQQTTRFFLALHSHII